MENLLTINPATADPTLIYLLLVGSIWIGITAAYIPGTGIIEALAGAGIIASFVFLAQMPTNWFAVMIVVVGLSGFIVMPFIRQQYATLAVIGLAMQAAGGLLLFDGLRVSLFVIALTVVIPFAYHQWVLLPMLRTIGQQPVSDRDNTILGMTGRVVKPITPDSPGTINIDGELWTAVSEQELPANEEVVVVQRQGLRLIVESFKPKREPDHSDQTIEEEMNN